MKVITSKIFNNFDHKQIAFKKKTIGIILLSPTIFD